MSVEQTDSVDTPCRVWPDDSAGVIRSVLERIGDKWSMLTVAALRGGPLRYSELQKSVTGISPRMLTLTLSHLVRDGLVRRTSHPEVPPRVEYELTELARGLLVHFVALIDWAGSNYSAIAANRAGFDAMRSNEVPRRG